MDAYIRGVIVTGAVCSVLMMLLPRGRTNKYVRYVSQLAVLLVLLAPISGMVDFVSGIRAEFPKVETGTSSVEQNIIAVSAENISRYIAESCAEKFSLTVENIKVRLILDESDTENVKITEIQIFTDEKRSEEKNRIKRYFEEMFCTKVYVFGP